MNMTNLPRTQHVRRNNRDFFSNLALLLEAGVSMFDALPLAVDTISNCVVRDDFTCLKRQVLHGGALA